MTCANRSFFVIYRFHYFISILFMNSHIHLLVQVAEQPEKDLLIATLSQIGFEGFEETETALHAYISEEYYNEKEMQNLLDGRSLIYSTSVMQMQNWNALWESNFEPITIGDFCYIRADFHSENKNVQHEVVITPKMSFGTGHHATTYMMIQEMSHMDFKNKSVADFGTGTGILAIMAEKLGGSKIWAIDNDDFSIENANENIERNNCSAVTIEKASAFAPSTTFDIILANINKNVILDNMENLINGLKPGAQLLMSGLLKQDEQDILIACSQHNINHIKTVERDKWIAILFRHTS